MFLGGGIGHGVEDVREELDALRHSPGFHGGCDHIRGDGIQWRARMRRFLLVAFRVWLRL